MAERLDVAIVSRGLATSRTRATKIIQAGLVTVDGKVQTKPATPVEADADIQIQEDTKWVSRAALKLLAALEDFGIDPKGRLALDIGASTGGFTQVLVEHGAIKVLAVDVGHSQMAELVANHTRVINLEKTNAKDLTLEMTNTLLGGLASIAVADVSFISVTHVLPAIVASTSADSDIILLIKPQFEVGKGRVKQGIVVSEDLREEAIAKVVDAATALHLEQKGLIDSPIVGTHGNHEYLIWLGKRKSI